MACSINRTRPLYRRRGPLQWRPNRSTSPRGSRTVPLSYPADPSSSGATAPWAPPARIVFHRFATDCTHGSSRAGGLIHMEQHDSRGLTPLPGNGVSLCGAVRISVGLVLEEACLFGSLFPAVQSGFEFGVGQR